MSRMLKALQQIEARSPQADQDAQTATPAETETEAETASPATADPWTMLAADSQVFVAGAEAWPVAIQGSAHTAVSEVALALPLGASPTFSEQADCFSGQADSPAPQHSAEVLPLQAAAGRDPGTPWPTPTGREHLQAYADLAGTIVSQLASHRSTVLLFTSPCDGDAEAGMLASLAATVAGQTTGEVLVVDANLPAPALTEYLGVEAAAGLSDVLRGAAAWKEVVCRSSVARLSLLPGSTRCGADGERVQSEHDPSSFAPLIRELREVYDVVLIDAPSLAHEEAARLAHHCDGVYLAVRLGHTPRRAVDEAVRVVGDCGGRVQGSILIGPQESPWGPRPRAVSG